MLYFCATTASLLRRIFVFTYLFESSVGQLYNGFTVQHLCNQGVRSDGKGCFIEASLFCLSNFF